MSKIQINQLNTSEFNELNSNETANVVGGRKGKWGRKSYYKKVTNNTRNATVNFRVNQQNFDDDYNQVTILTGNAKKGASSGVGVTINSGATQTNSLVVKNFSIN